MEHIKILKKFIYNQAEYGVPESNLDGFLSLFGTLIIDGAIEFDIDELNNLEKDINNASTNIDWTGGKDFYIDLEKASKLNTFNTIDDIEKWIKQYKYNKITTKQGSKQMDMNNILDRYIGDILISSINKSNPTIGLSIETMRQLTQLVEGIILEMRNKENKLILDKSSIDAIKDILSIKGKTEEIENEYKWSTKGVRGGISLIGIDILDLVSKALIKKALLISGVPGTGKTKCMLEVAKELAKDSSRIKLISLGQDNMTYSDFMIGQSNIGGTWKPTDGVLLEMCKKADADRENTYVLCIDEIGRGQTEAVFGELITAMEQRDTIINISYNKSLMVPSNLIILATRNIRDTSVTGLDLALYERFTQVVIEPQWNDAFIREISTDKEIIDILTKIAIYMNEINEIYKNNNRSYHMIGTRVITPSNQMLEDLTKDDILDMLETQLIPVLQHEQRLNSLNKSSRDEITSLIEEINGIIEESKYGYSK